MSPHQPALNERRNTVFARQDLISVLARAFDGLSVMSPAVIHHAALAKGPTKAHRHRKRKPGKSHFEI